jgi:hypothetical protein
VKEETSLIRLTLVVQQFVGISEIAVLGVEDSFLL